MDEDVELVLRRLAQARGDEAAWAALYTRFRPFIYALAYRGTNGSRELAKDATQEVFLRLVKYCPFQRFAGLGDFRPYLVVVTRNVVAALRRREGGAKAQAGLLSSSEGDLSEPILTPHGEIVELRQLLWQALVELPRADRQILALRLEGYSLEETAQRIGITPGHAAVRLHRIRKKLKRNKLLADIT
jgi:RNA polymerase sigma-70 factor, ECF subfamily